MKCKHLLMFLAILYVSMALSAGQAYYYSYCPSGFTYYAPSLKCYKLLETLNTQSNQEALCAALVTGGHLAAPLSADESTFIQNLAKNSPGYAGCVGTYRGGSLGWSTYWLGARRFSADGCATTCSQYTWLWKLGNGEWHDMTYKHFNTGEPNCNGGNDYCIHTWSDFSWNDVGCEDGRFCAVCEYDL